MLTLPTCSPGWPAQALFSLARAFWAPQAAVGFGIPGTPAEDRNFQAWLSVKAVRDIASGLFIFILLAGATPNLLGWFMLAAAGYGVPVETCHEPQTSGTAQVTITTPSGSNPVRALT